MYTAATTTERNS